jgi:acetoacetyl-CoA reductase
MENIMQRVALVTGGTKGLGEAIAIALQNAGHKVASTYCSDTEASRDFSRRTGIPVFQWDVSDFDACRTGIAQVEHEFGPIEILVNDAGVTADTVLHKMSPEQWWRVINTNLGSMFNMCRNVVEGMSTRGFGRIVNLSSVNGQTGQFGQTNYSAAKAGVHGFGMALARETERKGITVNTVSPGYCDTALVAAVPQDIREQIIADIPVGRLGSPGDIARAVAFLTADDAGYITGANLPVNGGYFMSF